MTGHRFHDVARTRRVATGHVFYRRHQHHHIQGELHHADRFHRAQHRAGTAHVVLHFVHFSRGLERYAAGVKRHALADQHHRCRAFFTPVVFKHDEFRRQVRGFGDGEQRIHAELFHVLFFKNRTFEFVCFGQIFCATCQIGRRRDIRRQIAQIFGEVHAFADGFAALDGRVQRFLVDLAIEMKCDGFADMFVFGFALHLIEAVRALNRGYRRLLDFPGDVSRGVFGIQTKGDIGRGRFFQHFERSRESLTKYFVAILFFNAKTDQQNAFGRDVRHRLQHQGAAAFAGNVAR